MLAMMMTETLHVQLEKEDVLEKSWRTRGPETATLRCPPSVFGVV
jgi:hypothetical protein